MRTMTGIAVLCWFAWLRLFPLQNTWAAWVGSLVSVIVFTLFAFGEYYGDTLPRTPSRKDLVPATSRVAFGALVGAVVFTGTVEPVAGGVIFGIVGALIGTYGGYECRRLGAKWCKSDLPAAITESAVALSLAVGSMYALHLASDYMVSIQAK